jgi:protein required for attachment to host cells
MLVPHNTLVLVADGGRFSLYRNKGRGFSPELELVAGQKQQVPASTVFGTDAPGRSFSSTGRRRSTYETPDFHQQLEDRFAIVATDALEKHVDESVDIIVVAPPKMLGTVRKSYGSRTKKRLIAEIDKDYADHTSSDIEEMLITWQD